MKLTAQMIGLFRKEFNSYLSPYMKVMDKPRQKVLPQLIEGMLSASSSFVAEAARKIDPESLETTERRFLRTLESPHWDEAKLWAVHLKQAAEQIEANTMLTIDITDLAKPHAKKLEALATVRDGSRKELTKGYWMLGVNAALKENRILPLVHEVFSQESDDFKSQNDILFFWLEYLIKLTSHRGLYVMDRGGDGDNIFNFFMNQKAEFLIRLVGNRILLSEGIPVSYTAVSSKLPFSLRKVLGKHHSNITFDWQTVTLPHRADKLSLITVRGYPDRKPMLLLTNKSICSVQEAALLIDAYFSRWEIEESFRFLKQSFRIEKFLIRNFRAIQRFFFLLCIAWGFLTRVIRFQRLRKLVETVSFPFPKKKINFFYYQWLRGLQFLLALIHTLQFLEVM